MFKGEYLNGKKWNGDIFTYDEYREQEDHYELKNGKGYIIDINSECFYKGEFVNGEKNGKGKEYYSYEYEKKILFQGEYLNGKRYGKGKEYYYINNCLRFEGIYKCGFKEEGKEYYPNGKLLFKGKYKSGVKWDGEGYDENGNIIYKISKGKGFIEEYEFNIFDDNIKDSYTKKLFEGEYLNGEKHGKGKEYNNKGEIIFEGEYYKGLRWNGKGKEYDNKGEIIFEGEYYKGLRWNGKGIEKYNDNVYDDNDEIIFEGEYYKGLRWNGKVYDYEDNKIFESEYKNGIKSEKFIEYDIDNMEKKNEIYLIKGSKQKNKRILLDENYEQSK